jgi:hypothetical protein
MALCTAPRNAPAATEPVEPRHEIDRSDSTRLLIPLPFFSKVGLQTGFVNTKELDTGVDFGALISKDFYRDFLEITGVLHLWGATNDSLDVATAALDGTFLYKIPVRWGLLCFGGFILSGNYLHREKTVTRGGVVQVTRSAHFIVERFITGGAELDIKGNRTVFVQLKYGTTDISPEFHVLFGLNFYTKYKKFIPWLAPPLMRD